MSHLTNRARLILTHDLALIGCRASTQEPAIDLFQLLVLVAAIVVAGRTKVLGYVGNNYGS